MKFLLLAFLPLAASSAILEDFKKNGIVYEEYGQGRLIREEQYCRPWTMDLFNYVNGLDISGMTEFGKTLLKRRLYKSFATVCEAFNVPSGTTEIPTSFPASILSNRFLDQHEINWNVQKFERDLKSLFLEHKLVAPFHEMVTENELRLFSSADAMDFSHRTTIFPSKCSVSQLLLEARVCKNISEPELSGPIYAIAHAGQFINDEQAFVYYETPSFVLVEEENVTAIDINQCKIMFGAYIFCFSTQQTTCNVKTMEGCQLMAVKGGADVTIERNFGRGKIVATTSEEIDVDENGNMEAVPSTVFTLFTAYKTNEQSVEVEDVKMTPIEYQAEFPSIAGESLSLLNEKPTPIYKTTRKGKNYLSHKIPVPNIWEDMKDFFLHLV